MAGDTTAPPPKREMKVLALGLFRTGTYSMSQALTTLGYANVYHGLNSMGNNSDWAILGNAADATFPSLPTYRGPGNEFTRQEWDGIWGSCEAVTDVASIFGAALVKAYPDAKVILVERDYGKWSKSVNETIITSLWGTIPNFFVNVVEPLLGSVTGPANRKMLLGWANAKDEKELGANLRAAWERHHSEIRETCAATPGRLLNYKLGDGWAPLCEFLGREVPVGEDGKPLPFPHANEATALRQKIIDQQITMLKKLAGNMLPWVGGATAAGAGWWWASSQGWI
ncbi:hypothetical protein B0T16DRAFT_414869 [Cercophora newfieldiana]|uniref:P-loop containing nucleoside triphosphate hydrolase protein n=1 Tax=Cercophora newfieldiana TaxID=92897 RepID=A0AA39XZW3_9PEZI|nr:hypothetical protein B0T16DRAFT_414869 [Cercophora newfieldiana]